MLGRVGAHLSLTMAYLAQVGRSLVQLGPNLAPLGLNWVPFVTFLSKVTTVSRFGSLGLAKCETVVTFDRQVWNCRHFLAWIPPLPSDPSKSTPGRPRAKDSNSQRVKQPKLASFRTPVKT